MIRKLIVALILLFGSTARAQDFEPHTTYGVQLNGKFTGLNVNNNHNGYYGSSSQNMGRGFDAVFHIERAEARWYGIGAGVGLSTIGTGGGKNNQLYYAVVPLRLQLKMGIVWFEPGLENRLFLGTNNEGPAYFDSETIKTYHLAGALGLRFKLFRGLSVNAGLSRGITPAIDLEGTDYELYYGDAYYNSIAGFFGVRYMFNQPY